MCGIVGAVASRNITPILVEGLKRLEYRGYDSCGVAVHADGALKRARSVSRVAELAREVADTRLEGFTGIAHTRWATHGAPAVVNAHPHFSRNRIALVHNGIIENHDTLRGELRARGYDFESQTDTEVIAHLIDHLYDGDLFAAVQAAAKRLQGAYAIAVFCHDEPHRVVGARAGSPLIVGVGKGENFLASDAMALAGVTDQIIYLEEGDVVDLQLGRVWISNADGRDITAAPGAHGARAFRRGGAGGPYRHYMQKEIFEQPRAIGDTLQGVEGIVPDLFGDNAASVFNGVDSVLILACGTSYYSGLTAKYWLESIAKIPATWEVASEYRYRDSVPNPRALVVTISQSGETADTMAALKHAKSLGHAHTLTICNVSTSAMVRECALAYITRAGVEIGVASTKAFTTQLAALFLLTLVLAKQRGHLDADRKPQHLKALRHLPVALGSVLALEPQIIARAEEFARKGKRPSSAAACITRSRWKARSSSRNQLHPRRGLSGRRAEARPAGAGDRGDAGGRRRAERHADRKAQEQPAGSARRGGEAVRVRRCRFTSTAARACTSSACPSTTACSRPSLHVVPLQLLAYHTATARGTDVDKPRNLAKSVTVE